MVGANPDGTQTAALKGNGRQSVGTLQANKYYTLSFSMYLKSNQQLYGELNTIPWSGGVLRFVNDSGMLLNIPNPLPHNQWINLRATVNAIAPAYAGQVGQPLYVHFWSTGIPNESLIDKATLLVDDSVPAPTTYYINYRGGKDSSDGLSPLAAWRTLANIN